MTRYGPEGPPEGTLKLATYLEYIPIEKDHDDARYVEAT